MKYKNANLHILNESIRYFHPICADKVHIIKPTYNMTNIPPPTSIVTGKQIGRAHV